MNGVDVGEKANDGKTCLDMTTNEKTRTLCKRWLKHLVVIEKTEASSPKKLQTTSTPLADDDIPLLEPSKIDIHVSARSDDLGELKTFGDKLTSVLNHRESGTGQTPLMAATLAGAEKSVKFLLEKGADATIPEKDGYTPFHGAGFQGRAAVAKHLLAHRLNPSDRHVDGFTPLHRACWGETERHTDMVEFLLMNGVDVGERANDGKTCLEMTRNAKTKAVCKRWLKYLVVKDEL